VVDAVDHELATFERVLDPARLQTDRGFFDFGLAFEPGLDHRLLVRTTGLAATGARKPFGCWSLMRLR
jgi:hypothetical protein